MSKKRTFNADARAAERGHADVIISGQTFHPLAKLPNRELRSIRRLAAEAQKMVRDVDMKFAKRERELDRAEREAAEGEDLSADRAALEDEREAAEEVTSERSLAILTEQLAVLLRSDTGEAPEATWLAEELDYRDAGAMLSWLLEDEEGNSSTPDQPSATTSG